jgi:hypothetical protein
MNGSWWTSRFGAACALLVRTQALAAASTALYRNQQVLSVPHVASAPSRRDGGKTERHIALPPVPFCPLLPRCATE